MEMLKLLGKIVHDALAPIKQMNVPEIAVTLNQVEHVIWIENNI
jgi:hypothetical protein